MKKKRKSFSLYKRNDVFYVRLWDEDRGEYTGAKSTGESDRDKAVLKADAMIKAGQVIKKENDPLFIDFIREYWQKRDELSTRYKHDLQYFLKIICNYPGFKNLRITELKAGHINRFIDHLQAEGTAPRTINRIGKITKTFIRWADSRDYIANDFSRKIVKVKEVNRRRGFLDPEEIFKLAAVRWPDIRMKAAVMLGCFAGLRRGEIRALQWQDIDFENNMITVRRNFVGDYDDRGGAIFKAPKAESERKAPYLLFPELKRTLLELWQDTPFKAQTDLLLVNVDVRRRTNGIIPEGQQPLSETTIKREFCKMLEGIGISRQEQRDRNLVFHGLRHSFASLMASLLPGNITMALTGHQTRAMLENYEHHIESAVNDGLKTANSALDKYRQENKTIQ